MNTMKELATLGVAADRMKSEGYGDQHPVADNATEEGRQKNRRIDLNVTAKLPFSAAELGRNAEPALAAWHPPPSRGEGQ